MSNLPIPVIILLSLALTAILALLGFTVYCLVRFMPIIGRIFEEKPMFIPLRLDPVTDVEEARFKASDGIELAGVYARARTPHRAGVLVFCHEFMGDRWSYQVYADWLRDSGFDIFAFDCRNHGSSESVSTYQPLQWVSDHETEDLKSALVYLRTRPDHDSAGFLLFGVSRGGAAAICAAAREQDVWGVITDGAFPTNGMMMAYIQRWASIYTRLQVRSVVLRGICGLLAWATRKRSERRMGCRYINIDGEVKRISPRPWLAFHGEKDTYIRPEIAKAFFEKAGLPRQLILVADAKHNRCLEADPNNYRENIRQFLLKHAPRPHSIAPPSKELAVSV